jgi:hypothetical protein
MSPTHPPFTQGSVCLNRIVRKSNTCRYSASIRCLSSTTFSLWEPTICFLGRGGNGRVGLPNICSWGQLARGKMERNQFAASERAFTCLNFVSNSRNSLYLLDTFHCSPFDVRTSKIYAVCPVPGSATPKHILPDNFCAIWACITFVIKDLSSCIKEITTCLSCNSHIIDRVPCPISTNIIFHGSASGIHSVRSVQAPS